MKRLYDWVLSWAHTPYGSVALFFLAFAESSFFPIPPDVLLIALAISIPARSFRYALICSAGSLLGGMFGYLIGYMFMGGVGDRIIELYHFRDNYEYIQKLYREYDAWAVGIAGFTPIPYKVFTITAGAFKIDFWVFAIASAVSRGARFFIVSGIIYFYGESIKRFIDRYFNILSIAFVVILIAGFAAVKLLLK
ncbi:MAG: DedA family protein [Deltaproteobacteria bacterium]|nr:DedA family protein [Deltaproteobacteria bacterium]